MATTGARTTATVQVPGVPRRVRWRAVIGKPGFIGLLAGGFWAFLGLWIGAAGAPPWEDRILDARARTGEATPVAVESTNAKVGRRGYVSRIRFRFRDALGVERTGSSYTPDSGLIALARGGQTLPMEYDAGTPRRARITDTTLSTFGREAVFPFSFGLIGLAVVIETLRRVARRFRLYTTGEAARGSVLSVSKSGTRVNGRPLLAVRYSFEGPFGPVEGTFKQFDAPGRDVTVLYDRRRPERSIIYHPDALR